MTASLTETQLIDHLAAPEISRRLGIHLDSDAHAVALSARGLIFEVTGADRRYIVRLPRDRAHLASLRQEARIAVYYRAFLFYLMVGQTGPRLEHLHRLLRDHIAYYATNHASLGKS